MNVNNILRDAIILFIINCWLNEKRANNHQRRWKIGQKYLRWQTWKPKPRAMTDLKRKKTFGYFGSKVSSLRSFKTYFMDYLNHPHWMPYTMSGYPVSDVPLFKIILESHFDILIGFIIPEPLVTNFDYLILGHRSFRRDSII